MCGYEVRVSPFSPPAECTDFPIIAFNFPVLAQLGVLGTLCYAGTSFPPIRNDRARDQRGGYGMERPRRSGRDGRTEGQGQDGG